MISKWVYTRSECLFAFASCFIHPCFDGTTDFSFIAIPGCTVNMTISSFKGSEDRIVALGSGLENTQSEHRDLVARVKLEISLIPVGIKTLMVDVRDNFDIFAGVNSKRCSVKRIDRMRMRNRNRRRQAVGLPVCLLSIRYGGGLRRIDYGL